MERIRIALMEKRVMLGDILARFGVVIGGGGGVGRNVVDKGNCSQSRCQVEALF